MMGAFDGRSPDRVKQPSPFLRLSNTPASVDPPVRRVPQRGVGRGVGREIVQMGAREDHEDALEERKFETQASVGALERRIGARPFDGDERGASLIKIAIEIGIAEAAEVRSLPLVLVGGDLRGVLEWVDAVGVGTDAPGPQSRLELTAFQQAALRVAAEQLAWVSLGRAHLGAELSPLPDQLISDGAA